MLFSCLSLLAALGAPAGLIAQEIQLRDVNVQMRRPGEDPVRVFQSITIGSQRTTVAAGTSLDEPLRRRGIHPDAEAYAALYQLNPSLRNARPDTGVDLLLPVLEGPELGRLVATGYQAYLTPDFGLKQRIAGRIQGVPGLERALAELSRERFGGAAQKLEMLATVSEIREMAVAAGLVIQGRTRPLSHELLSEIDGELAVTEAVVTGLAGPDKKVLTEADRDALRAVAEQAALRKGYWLERQGPDANQLMDPPPTVTVEVYTCAPTRGLAAPNARPDTTPCRGAAIAPGLRVYYRDVAGYGRLPPNPFAEPSPAHEALDVGNFFLWATQPNDSTVATEVVKVKVRSEIQPQRVVLILRDHD